MSRRRLALLLILLPGMLGLIAFATVWQRSQSATQEQQAPVVQQAIPGADDAVTQPDGSGPEVPPVLGESEDAPAATQSTQGTQGAEGAPAASETTQQEPGEVSGPPQFAQDRTDQSPAAEEGAIRLAALGQRTLSNRLSEGTSHGSAGGANSPGSKSRPEDSSSGEGADHITDSTPQPESGDHHPQPGPVDHYPPIDDDYPSTDVPGDDDPGVGPHEPPVQVPEPGTLGLFVLALCGCAVRRDRC